jgi:hypothetical protein
MRTPKELSEVLGVGINGTYRALECGQVKGAIRIGGRWLIPDLVIERILSGQYSAAA